MPDSTPREDDPPVPDLPQGLPTPPNTGDMPPPRLPPAPEPGTDPAPPRGTPAPDGDAGAEL